MSIFKITGGTPLSGTVKAAGNKNAVLPMIAAAMLTDEEVILENVPAIRDVRTMLGLANSFGVGSEWDEESGILKITAAEVSTSELPRDKCKAIRAGILFAAPLLYRTSKAVMYPPGGDVIGRRRLDSHLYGLEALGVEVKGDMPFQFSVKKLIGRDLFLPEASVTATAQILLAAAVADGSTIIRNAACEPHISDLAIMLNKMGANISGIGSNNLTIHGVKKLRGTRHRVSSDYTEAGSFLALAAATRGEVTVTDIDPTHYRMIRRVFRRCGIELAFTDNTVTVGKDQKRCFEPSISGGFPMIDDGIWPQFPSDLMSVMIVMATQLKGTMVFFEKLYESRMYFVDRLVDMGAKAIICDPHRIVIGGPSPLQGIDLISPDIRAGIAMVGAALCAEGESIIHNVHLIDRGYENIETKLAALGANIQRIEKA